MNFLRTVFAQEGNNMLCRCTSDKRVIYYGDLLVFYRSLENCKLHSYGEFSLLLCALDERSSDISVLEKSGTVRNAEASRITFCSGIT